METQRAVIDKLRSTSSFLRLATPLVAEDGAPQWRGPPPQPEKSSVAGARQPAGQRLPGSLQRLLHRSKAVGEHRLLVFVERRRQFPFAAADGCKRAAE